MMAWTRRTFAMGALAATAIVGACDSGGTGPGEDGTGSVVVSVTANDTAASGVSVSLFEAGGSMPEATETTDAAGEASFTGLAAGTYAVELTVPSGLALAVPDSARQTVTVGADAESTLMYALESAAADAPADTVEVTLTNYAFTPGDLTIAPNTLVRWVNDTNTFHTITPDGHTEWTEGSVDQAGETFSHVFMTEGQFPYYCSPHQSFGMVGSVTVEAQ